MSLDQAVHQGEQIAASRVYYAKLGDRKTAIGGRGSPSSFEMPTFLPWSLSFGEPQREVSSIFEAYLSMFYTYLIKSDQEHYDLVTPSQFIVRYAAVTMQCMKALTERHQRSLLGEPAFTVSKEPAGSDLIERKARRRRENSEALLGNLANPEYETIEALMEKLQQIGRDRSEEYWWLDRICSNSYTISQRFEGASNVDEFVYLNFESISERGATVELKAIIDSDVEESKVAVLGLYPSNAVRSLPADVFVRERKIIVSIRDKSALLDPDAIQSTVNIEPFVTSVTVFAVNCG